MPAGRSNRVLFDLIPQRDAEPSRAASNPTSKPPAKPVVRVELKPQESGPTPRSSAAPASPTPHSAPRAAPHAPHAEPSHTAPHPAATAAPSAAPRSVQELPRAAGTPYSKPATAVKASPFRWPAFLGNSALPVPLNLIYLSVAALVILAVVFFIWGRAAGEAAAIDRLGAGTLDIPAVVEPDPRSDQSPRLLPPPTNPTPGITPTPAPGAGRQAAATPVNNTPAPIGAILTVRGAVMTDPRVVELNYLSLASLGEDDAKAAIAFLSANGIDAIGVPRVDPGASRANNQGPTQVYRIYALPGITRDEYSQKLTARTNLEAAVAKIGATWQKEHRGASNFARTQWEKFRP